MDTPKNVQWYSGNNEKPVDGMEAFPNCRDKPILTLMDIVTYQVSEHRVPQSPLIMTCSDTPFSGPGPA